MPAPPTYWKRGVQRPSAKSPTPCSASASQPAVLLAARRRRRAHTSSTPVTASAVQTSATTSFGGFSLSSIRRQVAQTKSPATADQEQADPVQSRRRRATPASRRTVQSADARQHAPAERPPAAHADDRQRAGGDRQQVAEQHRRVGRLAADDRGADEAADEGEAGDEDAVAQRHADREGGQRHRAAAGRDLGNHVVERDGREQARRRARRRRRRPAPAPRDRRGAHLLGAADQGEAEQRRQDHPHFGREIALLDRVADEEDRRERQRDGADPDEGARAQALLPAAVRPARPTRRRRQPAGIGRQRVRSTGGGRFDG